ncbi:MAG: rRNA maturation RNase YbeY [Bacteroidetes bacterium]|jgi:probable rRNA maturation factor|nr:rRNA maturation RNase YbeY [Bacteroidota bacterium]
MIHFEAIDLALPESINRKTKDWIMRVIKQYGRKTGEVFFLFCSDNYLLHINQTFLQHDYFTDIITFPASASSAIISGELFISLDRITDNAKNLAIEFEVELHRVMIHGVLHLMGYEDKTTSEQAIMRAEEEKCLSLRP